MNFLFLGTFEDEEYKAHLKGMFNGFTTYTLFQPIEFLSHLEMYCAKRSITRVVTTSTKILSLLLALRGNIKGDPSLNDYAGSVFTYKQLELVFISPLKQLFTVKYGKFLCQRFISKLTTPAIWREATSFHWTLLTPTNVEAAYHDLGNAFAIAADIETFRNPLSIRCIGYTGIFLDSQGNISTRSYVLPLDSLFALTWMRKINWSSPPKIFQNGKYDVSYLLRYNAPVKNWFYDTINFMHCWYSELPKDLAFINAFFLREVVYWKDLAETNDLHEYYKYNALDTWATANVFISWILSAPGWARKNYVLEFPLDYPCLLAEMTGLQRDQGRLEIERKRIDEVEAAKLKSLRIMVGAENFNPGSPTQVKDLLKILGCSDIQTSGVNDVFKAKLRHPLNARVLSLVSNKKDEDATSIRGLRKLKSTYLRIDSDAKQSGIHEGEGGAKEFKGRILYALNPHGTDTARLASKSHHFWCGLQIHNIPVGPEIKSTIRCEDGFYLGEADLEQAESRDTAYISGDTSLIKAVEGTRDFHSLNASAFFGIPYDQIYDDVIRKTKNKKLRDLSKRTNHGANYNMGWAVLIETMGVDKIYEAGRLLGLTTTDPRAIAEHLLAAFDRTYPRIRKDYYESVISEVTTTQRLTSRAFHHTEYNLGHYQPDAYISEGDWTRYCFGRPDKNKLDLNSYVAHCPQSLNSRTLNEAFMRVFYEIALPNPRDFRLHAQIHDSILFSYRSGFDHLPAAVKKCMEIPITIKDVSGIVRNFTVPASLKLGKTVSGTFQPAIYWSETE